MHLDLRLDNILVTPAGVSFVDFGSAIRIGEKFSGNPMLHRLIQEMLQASQITADLRRQQRKGLIQSPIFRGLPLPPSPAFDLYALTTNLTRPHDHDEFKGLIAHDRTSDEGQWFSQLRRRTLKPAANESPIRSAAEMQAAVLDSPHLDPAHRVPPVTLSPAPPVTHELPAPVVLTGSLHRPAPPPRGAIAKDQNSIRPRG